MYLAPNDWIGFLLAEFPHFAPVSIENLPAIARMVHPFAHFADFNPVEIWCWNRGHPGGVCRLHGNPVIRWKNPAGSPYLSFAAHHAFRETATTLLDHARTQNLSPHLRAIPIVEESAVAPGDDTLVVTADRDNFDYLLDVEEWAQLHGGRFRNVRNAISQLERRHAISIRQLSLDATGTRLQIERLCQRWAHHRRVSPSQFLPELTAIRNLFDFRHPAGLFVLGAIVDDTLVGFSVNERLAPGMAIGHFAKADYAYPGVYPWLLHHVCVRLRSEGVTTINIEADLGVAGLRRAKQLLHPVGFLRKVMLHAP